MFVNSSKRTGFAFSITLSQTFLFYFNVALSCTINLVTGRDRSLSQT